MVASKTLQDYITRCDEMLASPDKSNAELLEREIVSVFRNDFQGITNGLDLYGIGVLNGIMSADIIKDIRILKARLQKELDALQLQSDPDSVKADTRIKKIFISHATKDKDYVGEIIALLESLGFREDEIICSSIPPYCIPLDNNVYDWLVNEFLQSDLHVIYALSDTYYNRPTCLNEMGAAWALKQKWTGILLPGFEFEKIEGCIDPYQISIKLDDSDRDTLRFRLGELKDNLISEFGLRPISDYLWEKKRNEFLDGIAHVMEKRIDNQLTMEEVSEEEENMYSPVVGIDDVGNIPIDSAFLLVYAAEGDGQILKIKTLSEPTQITVSGKSFMEDNSIRESAKWVEALDRLVAWGWVKPVGYKGEIFELTGTGYTKAEWLKDGMKIDTSKEPLEELKEFEK